MNATPPMTTATPAPAAATTSGHLETIDTSRPGVPMSRLIAVELRKLVNTRAGLWLVLAIGLVSLLIMTAMLIWADDSDLVFGNIFGLMNIPTGFLLPVLAILLVTSEWGQRTGLVTFTLEPRRSRVVVAKLATALVAAVGAMLTAMAFGALGNLLAGLFHDEPAGKWEMTHAGMSNSVMLQLFALLMGFAFGMLIRNSAAAIVLYFVIPTIWSILAQVIPWVHDHLQKWADFSFAQQPFQSGEWATGQEWAHLATSGTIWLVLPLVIGIWRLLRSEVK
jgi:ABC-type transport system involved in multi-copper enzyme maturation permease subunit